jgi:hypothetical protein
MIGKIRLKQTSHLLPPVFADGKWLFAPEFPATSPGRWDGSKNPYAALKKATVKRENSLWNGPSTRHGWFAAGENR